jgi:hypothetical protein
MMAAFTSEPSLTVRVVLVVTMIAFAILAPVFYGLWSNGWIPELLARRRDRKRVRG